jgi:sulfide:quinone oxidoreductase
MMQHKTVIVGAGTAGMALQHRLSRYYNQQGSVGVIEPTNTHYYQPLWTLVGGGKKSLQETGRPMSTLMHNQVHWHQDQLASFQPKLNKITMKSGFELEYENLIVATGIQLNFGAIEGLTKSLAGPVENGVCSNYDKNTVLRTWENVQRLTELAKIEKTNKSSKKLQAIFTQPPMPIKCAGAPQKIMYLAHEHWKKAGVLENIEITFCTAMPGIFSQPDYAAALRQVCVEKGIKNIEYGNNLLEIKNGEAVFANNVKKFDMIHVTPAQCAPDVCKESELSNETGFIDVNPKTLQSTKFKNVWALGDCSSVPTSKTAAAVAGQNQVLYENLVASIEGETEPVALYDGYTSCPLVVGEDKCIMAEFNYKMQRQETMWYDQSVPSRLSYYVKAEQLPELYWKLHCTGNWGGPRPVREIFQTVKNWLNN